MRPDGGREVRDYGKLWAMRRGFYGLVLVLVVVATFAWGPTILGLSTVPSPDPGPAATSDPPPTQIPSPSPTLNATPLGFASIDGYGVTLPAGWTASSVGREEQGMLLDLLKGSNPDLAALVHGILEATGAEVSMVGGDIHSLSQGGVPPNVSVLVEPATGVTLDDAAANTARLIAGLRGVNAPISQSHMSLPAIDTVRFEYTVQRASAATPIRLQTYVATRGTRIFLISCATSPDRFEGQRSFFDEFIRSFRPTA